MTVKQHQGPIPAVHRSYAEALAACPQGAYEMDELVAVVVEKTCIANEQMQQSRTLDAGAWRTLMAAGLANHEGVLNVIDFGGAAGYHHAMARLALGSRVQLNWCVVETSAMARQAARLERSGLKFFDHLQAALAHLGRVDLVFTSSALQYCSDPLITLERLLGIGADRFFLTRTPLADTDQTIVTTQSSMLGANGPGPLPPNFSDRVVAYPVSYVPRARVEALIQQHYAIRFSMLEENATLFAGGKALNAHYGYFCERRFIGHTDDLQVE
jgi:putative methyltransferase (TIGR04325 family)